MLRDLIFTLNIPESIYRGHIVEEEHIKLSLELEKKAQDAAQKMGHQIINLTPEEIELWVKATVSVREKWIVDMEQKGKSGRAIFEEAQRLINLYNQ